MRWQLTLLAALCGVFSYTIVSAQTYLRYVNPEDLGSKALYADSVLTSIRLPQGVASLSNYPKFNLAALELLQIMNDPTKEVMQVYVCGSASPDGLWADNVKLSQARTDAAAKYLMEVLDIPSYKIHGESLNEDWDRLYELVAASDMPQKYSVMNIIRTKEWGERKRRFSSWTEDVHGVFFLMSFSLSSAACVLRYSADGILRSHTCQSQLKLSLQAAFSSRLL